MSSTYRTICLSHDPALFLDETTGTVPPVRPNDHPRCTIGLARTSGALVEVWLPIKTSELVDGRLVDRPGSWFEVQWMHRFPGLAGVLADEARPV